MRVAIIVPAYNTERFLALTLESVLSLTRPDWELIVVNDGSTDTTGSIAETFSRKDSRIRVVHQQNVGIAGALNRGFSEIGRDCAFCMLLGSDDVVKPDALEVLIPALERDPSAVAVHGLLEYIDSNGRPLTVNGAYTWPGPRFGVWRRWLAFWPISRPTSFEVLAYHDFVPPSGTLMRRAAKESVGDFDENLAVREDWDMWLRLSCLGHFVFVKSVVYSYRIHENNVSKDRELMRENELYVRRKMYTSADLDEEKRRSILVGYRYNELVSAVHGVRHAVSNLIRGRGSAALRELQAGMRHGSSWWKGEL